MLRAIFTQMMVVIFMTNPTQILSNSTTPRGMTGSTINVSTTVDSFSTDGQCSLREAVQSANLDIPIDNCPAGSGADTIVLLSNTYSLTLAGTFEDNNQTGDIDITSDVTILGAGESTIIDGNEIDRVFHVVDEDAIVVFTDIRIQNGNAPYPDVQNLGGGGILSAGSLTLIDVHLLNNFGERGAGVRNSKGVLVIESSTLDHNSAIVEGGGVYGDGPVEIYKSLIDTNTAGYGAGISSDSILILEDTTLHANEAEYDGGGLYNDANAFADRVTIYNNEAGRGAGIYNNNFAFLYNITISDNTAIGSQSKGGGIYNTNQASLRNLTIVGNTATLGGGIYNAQETSHLTFANSILAFNTLGNCINEQLATMESQGSNLESHNSCGLDEELFDQPNTNPLLGPLGLYDGYTLMYELLPTSPAIDTGSNVWCAQNDQRSYSRPVDGDRNGELLCDVGSYELAMGGVLRLTETFATVDEEGSPVVTLTVTRTGGDGAVMVGYRASGGSAIVNRDYSLTPGVLSWAEGDHSSKSFSLQVNNDPYKENEEYTNIILYNPTNGATMLSPYYQFLLTILPSDPTGPEEPKYVYLPSILR